MHERLMRDYTLPAERSVATEAVGVLLMSERQREKILKHDLHWTTEGLTSPGLKNS